MSSEDLVVNSSSRNSSHTQNNTTQIVSDHNSISQEEIFKLPDDKIYDYFNFEKTVRNWNDFLQPKFPNISLNEIKTVDVDINSRSSYLKGKEFLKNHNFHHIYHDLFEDNFRKYLENCDKLELLHINVDFNSFWGGLSNFFFENIHDQIPKVPRVFYGTDLHSSFYSQQDNSFNVEKLMNYLWYFTDLLDEKTNSIFLPIYKIQNPSVIKNTFSYSYKPNNDPAVNTPDPVYDYYYSSLVGLNLHNLYMPLRSNYFGNASNVYNLHHNDNFLNFIETDTIFGLENENYSTHICGGVGDVKTNGILINFSRNITHPEFNWKKIYENSIKMNKFNSSIVHGIKDNYSILGEKIESFLIKHSGLNYTSGDRLDLPMCYPRKIKYISQPAPKFSTSEVFLKDMSVMCNYRPFPEFSLKNLKFFPEYFEENDNLIKKHLLTYDTGKYIEYKDKVEEMHALLESYEYFSDSYLLLLDSGKSNSDDELDI
jgi:hypothetical protein